MKEDILGGEKSVIEVNRLFGFNYVAMDLNRLSGFNYLEVVNPIYPFKIKAPEINEAHMKLLKKWDSIRDTIRVRYSTWVSVMASVRDSISDSAWSSAWPMAKVSVGASVGDLVRGLAWDSVRDSAWALVRATVRARVESWGGDSFVDPIWDSVGASVWGYIGSLFPGIRKWKYIEHKEGEYPFDSVVSLYKEGIVPSFDGSKWRLHVGEKAKIVWKGKI